MSGRAALFLAAVAFLIGGIVAGSTEWAWMPKDKLEASKEIHDTQIQMNAIANMASEGHAQVSELQRQIGDLTQRLNKANADLVEAKAAKPGRFEVINRGARTWRLDTATGKSCLLLAPDADWKRADVEPEACPAE